MPNKRKYTSAKQLASAINKYLRSIRTRSIVYEVDAEGCYVLDKSVDPWEKIPAKDDNGKPLYVERYVVPPELHHIADAVGMCYDTWLKYASGEYDTDDECFSKVCSDAKELCLRWALKEMHTRTKGIAAMEWVLRVNYGISDESNSSANEIVVKIKSSDDGYEE